MHVRRVLALTVVAPLVLAGCSDGDPEAEPTPKMPETSSSSPTPTESETAEPESAEDFIRRWVEVGDEMQVTGETAEYAAMVDKSCKACQSFVSSVKDVYSGGGSVHFDGATIDKVVQREPKPPTFALTKTLPETTIDRGTGAAPQVLPAGTTTLLVILGKKAKGWVVTYYGVL